MTGPESDNKPRRSGRVRHETGGRAIWEWAVDSGRHALDSTSRLLQKLDLSSLTLLGDDEKPWQEDQSNAGSNKPPGQQPRERETPPTFGGPREEDPLGNRNKSFNPYDNRLPTSRGRAIPPKPAAPPRPRVTQPMRAAQPTAKKGLLAKLLGRK